MLVDTPWHSMDTFGQRIDIITKIDGLSFDEAYADRNYHTMGDMNIPFLSLDSIVKNKKSSGREKDLLDIKELQKWKEKRTGL